MTDTAPKRRLANFDFSEDGAHIALVHKDQGGAANGYKTLLTKSSIPRSKTFLTKAASVQITLTFEEFLQRFFDMWYTDAKVLATLLGLQEDEDEDSSDWYKDHVAERVAQFEILKSAKESSDFNPDKFFAALDETAHLDVLQLQEKFEKALASQPEIPPNPTNEDTTMAGAKAPNTPQPEVETVTKAAYTDVQKALDDSKAELTKALDELNVYKAAQKEALLKQRHTDVTAAIDNKEDAEKLLKALEPLDADAFTTVLAIVKGLNKQVNDSALFTEQGSGSEGEKVQKSALRAQLDKQLNKSN